MKKLNINLVILFLGVLVISCESPEGALYSGEPNKASFFCKSINLVMTDGTLKVPIARTSKDDDFTVPVTLSADNPGYTDVFKIASPVTFNQGSAKTYVSVTYSDISGIDPSTLTAVGDGFDVIVGLAFPFTLTIDKSVVSYSNVPSVKVFASSTLEFEDYGTAVLDSREGWWGGETEEDFLTPQIQKAVGVNVYKLIQPFGFNNFAFMIKSDNTVICPDQVIYDFGPSDYGPVSITSVAGYYDPEFNVVVLEVGAYRVAAGSFGGGVEIIYLPDL